jgi:diguanylate cyclase (GGDEF)-like protein
VYPFPETPLLAGLELPELSPEEAALSDDEKIALARTLVLNEDWGTYKNSVSSNVTAAVESIRAASSEQAAQISQSIATLRTLLIVDSVLIIAVLIVSFFLFYRLLVAPLGRFSRLISDGQELDDSKGLRESRVLAGSYNDLSRRRDALETILREAAETDTLTGLPNRYSMQQHRLEAEGEGYSLTAFVFDVDNLKTTNDTFGHAAGDDLIRRAAYCISTCFAEEVDGRCYRLAGDEFAAIIKGLDEAKIAELAEKFEALQAQNNVSISWGYAHTKEVSDTTFRALMDEADQRMYQMKEIAHKNGNHSA